MFMSIGLPMDPGAIVPLVMAKRRVAPPGSLGYRFRKAREARKLTQTKAATLLGISQPSLSLIEIGDSLSVEGETLVRASKHYKKEAEWLLHGAGPEMKQSLDPDESEAVSIFQALDEHNLDAWMAMGRHYLERQGVKSRTAPFAGVAKPGGQRVFTAQEPPPSKPPDKGKKK